MWWCWYDGVNYNNNSNNNDDDDDDDDNSNDAMLECFLSKIVWNFGRCMRAPFFDNIDIKTYTKNSWCQASGSARALGYTLKLSLQYFDA